MGLLVKVADQVGGQDGWIWAKLNCQSILNTQAWSISDLLYGFREIYFLRDSASSPKRENSVILPARVARSVGFVLTYPITELAI